MNHYIKYQSRISHHLLAFIFIYLLFDILIHSHIHLPIVILININNIFKSFSILKYILLLPTKYLILFINQLVLIILLFKLTHLRS